MTSLNYLQLGILPFKGPQCSPHLPGMLGGLNEKILPMKHLGLTEYVRNQPCKMYLLPSLLLLQPPHRQYWLFLPGDKPKEVRTNPSAPTPAPAGLFRALRDCTQAPVLLQQNRYTQGTSLVAQWLRLRTPNAQGMGSSLAQGTKIPHAVWCNQKIRKKQKSISRSIMSNSL